MLIKRTNFLNPFNFDFFDNFNEGEVWKPSVDVKDEEKKIIVEVELPGLDKKDVKVSVDKGVLKIEGERKIKKESDYQIVERHYGSFLRSFSLPEYLNGNEIEASFNKGVLIINIPKGPKKIPKQIQIN